MWPEIKIGDRVEYPDAKDLAEHIVRLFESKTIFGVEYVKLPNSKCDIWAPRANAVEWLREAIFEQGMFTDRELFTKKYFPFDNRGTLSVGSYTF